MFKKVITLSSNSAWYLFNFRSSTIKKFINEGFNVVCICPEGSYVKDLILLGCDWKNININRKGTNPLSDLLIFCRFLMLYLKIRPIAAFHFTIKNNIYGTLAASLVRVKSINNITGLGTTFINKNFTTFVVLFLYRLSQPLAKTVFCQNPDDQNFIIEKKIAIPAKVKLLAGSGINLKKIHPSLKRDLPIDRVFRFLFAGRLLGDKGLNELIEALKHVNKDNIQCHIWVSGFLDLDNISAITKDTLESWMKFEWFKWMGETKNIENVMAQIDCVVLPSYREGMPRLLIEAGAMALPSITTDVPGCNHIIKHQFNGLICKVKNINSLSEVICEMLSLDEFDRKLMGNNARKYVEKNFDEEFVVNAAFNEVQEIIRK